MAAKYKLSDVKRGLSTIILYGHVLYGESSFSVISVF